MDMFDVVLIVLGLAILGWFFLAPKSGNTTLQQQAQQQISTQPQASQSTTLQIPVWLIATFFLAAGLAVLTQFVNPWIVFVGVTVLVILMGAVIFVYQKEDLIIVPVSGQTSDGSLASVEVQVTVSKKATGIFEFLQLTIFDLQGEDYHRTVVAVITHLTNAEIGKLPSDRFQRGAGELQKGLETALALMPDNLFEVRRVAFIKLNLPQAMVEAMVQRATAVAGAQTVAITVQTVIQQLVAAGLPVTDATTQVAITELLHAQADVDRISAAGHSFGALFEWALQRFGRILGGGDGTKKP